MTIAGAGLRGDVLGRGVAVGMRKHGRRAQGDVRRRRSRPRSPTAPIAKLSAEVVQDRHDAAELSAPRSLPGRRRGRRERREGRPLQPEMPLPAAAPGGTTTGARHRAADLSYFELDGLRPQRLGLGAPRGDRHDARRRRSAASSPGRVIGTLVAWAKLVAQPRRARPRRRLHHGPARHPRPPRHLPVLFRRQRRARRDRRPVRRRRLHRRAGLRDRRARHRRRVRRLSGRGLPRRLPDAEPRRARGGDARSACTAG